MLKARTSVHSKCASATHLGRNRDRGLSPKPESSSWNIPLCTAWGTSFSAVHTPEELRGCWLSWQLWLCSSPGPPTAYGICSLRPCTPRRTWVMPSDLFSQPSPYVTKTSYCRGVWRRRTYSALGGGWDFWGETGRSLPLRERRSHLCGATAVGARGTSRPGPRFHGFWTLTTFSLLPGSPSRPWGSCWTGWDTSWRRCCYTVGTKESSAGRAISAPWVCRQSWILCFNSPTPSQQVDAAFRGVCRFFQLLFWVRRWTVSNCLSVSFMLCTDRYQLASSESYFEPMQSYGCAQCAFLCTVA